VTGTAEREQVRLRTGQTVELRPMDAADAAALVDFHHRLSPETTYLRFFNLHPELSEREVHRFTHVDHDDRDAIVATVDDQIVAVGRYDRRPGETEAEVAFVVADAWQRRGIGSVLLARLTALARRRGLERLTAETLAVNRPMLEVFRASRLPMATTLRDGVVHVALELG
jgi:GNAT superfamily N-acetyltransferase